MPPIITSRKLRELLRLDFVVANVEIGELERLGQALELPGVVLSRLLKQDSALKTLFLCLLAIGCDYLVARLVAKVLERQFEVRKEQRAMANAARMGGKDVIYLWKPAQN